MAAFFVPAPSSAGTITPSACTHTYIAATYHLAANRIYHQHQRVTRRQRHRLAVMRACAATPADHRAMRNITRRQHHARVHRALLAGRTCGTPACNRELARHMADLRYGPGGFACLDAFIGRHESGWSDDIEFGGHHGPPGHLAWGIPQALPPQKMASAGPDWATNPATQIRWLFGYVDSRYGGPCAALRHWLLFRSY